MAQSGDAGIWNACSLEDGLENNYLKFLKDHVIVGDDAFPLTTYLMKPYGQQNGSRKERIFDYRLSRARRIVENAFGILAWRFRIFQRPFETKLDTSDLTVWAACSLHNWLRHLNPKTTISLAVTEDDMGDVIPGRWRAVPRQLQPVNRLGSNNYSRKDKEVRESYATYFMNEGAIPWQWKRAKVSEFSSDEETDADINEGWNIFSYP